MSNSQIQILIVDDDKSLRSAIAETLKIKGYVVFEAENGQKAWDFLESMPVRIVISDVQMPVMDGIDLLRKIAAKDASIKVIMMTGFSQILEAQQAYEMGASEFLAKPFKENELLDCVANCLLLDSAAEESSSEKMDAKYCKIAIGDLQMGSTTICEVFLRLSPYKYIKIAHSGIVIPVDRLKHYKSKGAGFIYVKTEDYAKYVGLSMLVIKNSTVTKQSSEQKLRLLKHGSDTLLEFAFKTEVTKETFEASSEIIQNVLKTLVDDDDLFQLLDVLNSHADFLYAHAIGVSLYASLISRELGWKAGSTQFKVSMAGLFHDIGKKEISRHILEKKRADMTMEEFKLYETHTTRGRDIMNQLRKIPEDVAIVALQHHESNSGMGFPSRLKKEQIHPLARLIGLTDLFCTLILHGPHSHLMSPHQAIDYIWQYHRLEYDPQMIKALMQLYNYPQPPEILKVQIK